MNRINAAEYEMVHDGSELKLLMRDDIEPNMLRYHADDMQMVIEINSGDNASIDLSLGELDTLIEWLQQFRNKIASK
jgi:hypothetical protein